MVKKPIPAKTPPRHSTAQAVGPPRASIRKIEFQRMVRCIAQGYRPGLRFRSAALELLQDAAERHMVSLFHEAQIIATAMQNDCLCPQHIRAVRALRPLAPSS